MMIAEHTAWEIETSMAPDAVLAALTDFGPDRSRIWRESSHPKVYKVHATGPAWAEVTEGVTVAWSRERYDWSAPGVVTLTQLDSNVATGSGTIRYTLLPMGEGTRITCDRHRLYRSSIDGLRAGIFMRLLGPRVLRWQFGRGLVRASGLTRTA